MLYAKERSRIEIVNDINSELINLHKIIKTRPQTLHIYLQNLLSSRELFYDIKKGKIKPRNDIERAAYYYFLITNSFSSTCSNFAMPKRRSPKDLHKSFLIYSKRMHGLCIENMSFEKLIRQYDSSDILFYYDPPYYGTEHYYLNTGGFGAEKHILLRDLLKKIKGRFVLSYNNCAFIKELYSDFNIREINVVYTMDSRNRKKASELIITN